MALVVESPGTLATIQDLGRPGYRTFGVPVSGAFDRDAYTLANALLANEPGAAALELTLVGGVYRAEIPLAIALVGAPMEARINAADGTPRTLRIPQTASLLPGDRLTLGGSALGARTYLAVRGGLLTPNMLGSRSSETPLRAGDRLPTKSGAIPTLRPAFDPRPDSPDDQIRVIDAAEWADRIAWHGLRFRLSARSDRMGLRLEGPTLEVPHDPDRASAPVAPGAVQVAGGRPIVLGPACGTMGGYPVVAHVISADINRLGQLRPGDPIRFQLIDLLEARRLDREWRLRRAAWALRTAALVSAAADQPPGRQDGRREDED